MSSHYAGAFGSRMNTILLHRSRVRPLYLAALDGDTLAHRHLSSTAVIALIYHNAVPGPALA